MASESPERLNDNTSNQQEQFKETAKKQFTGLMDLLPNSYSLVSDTTIDNFKEQSQIALKKVSLLYAEGNVSEKVAGKRQQAAETIFDTDLVTDAIRILAFCKKLRLFDETSKAGAMTVEEFFKEYEDCRDYVVEREKINASAVVTIRLKQEEREAERVRRQAERAAKILAAKGESAFNEFLEKQEARKKAQGPLLYHVCLWNVVAAENILLNSAHERITLMPGEYLTQRLEQIEANISSFAEEQQRSEDSQASSSNETTLASPRIAKVDELSKELVIIGEELGKAAEIGIDESLSATLKAKVIQLKQQIRLVQIKEKLISLVKKPDSIVIQAATFNVLDEQDEQIKALSDDLRHFEMEEELSSSIKGEIVEIKRKISRIRLAQMGAKIEDLKQQEKKEKEEAARVENLSWFDLDKLAYEARQKWAQTQGTTIRDKADSLSDELVNISTYIEQVDAMLVEELQDDIEHYTEELVLLKMGGEASRALTIEPSAPSSSNAGRIRRSPKKEQTPSSSSSPAVTEARATLTSNERSLDPLLMELANDGSQARVAFTALSPAASPAHVSAEALTDGDDSEKVLSPAIKTPTPELEADSPFSSLAPHDVEGSLLPVAIENNASDYIDVSSSVFDTSALPVAAETSVPAPGKRTISQYGFVPLNKYEFPPHSPVSASSSGEETEHSGSEDDGAEAQNASDAIELELLRALSPAHNGSEDDEEELGLDSSLDLVLNESQRFELRLLCGRYKTTLIGNESWKEWQILENVEVDSDLDSEDEADSLPAEDDKALNVEECSAFQQLSAGKQEKFRAILRVEKSINEQYATSRTFVKAVEKDKSILEMHRHSWLAFLKGVGLILPLAIPLLCVMVSNYRKTGNCTPTGSGSLSEFFWSRGKVFVKNLINTAEAEKENPSAEEDNPQILARKFGSTN